MKKMKKTIAISAKKLPKQEANVNLKNCFIVFLFLLISNKNLTEKYPHYYAVLL